MVIKIIAIGNIYRRDDGAAILAARGLTKHHLAGVEILEALADPSALFAAWEGASAVIVIDASAPAGKPGQISRIVACENTLHVERPSASTHALGLAKTVELADALGQLPSRLIIYAIEGENFDYGEGLSAPVFKALNQLIDRVRTEALAIAEEEYSHA